MDQSMYIESGTANPNGSFADELASANMLRRYSVIGNDPSFKQYTKNHDYNNVIKQQEQAKKQAMRNTSRSESFLQVSLKDLAEAGNHQSVGPNNITSNFGL